MQPYIGVSGITSRREAAELLASVPGETAGRRLMIGVLANVRTLAGLDSERGRNRHPPVERIAEIFPDHPLALSCLHFYSHGEAPLAESLRKVVELAGPRLQAVQLNVAWPPPEALRELRSTHPGLALIFQVRAGAEDESSPVQAAERVHDLYRGLLDAVLFDPSRGLGRLFDPAAAGAFLGAMARADPDLGLGVAGGLCAETLPLVRSLRMKFPQLSVDAEARLRDEEDRLVPARASAYVRRAFEMLAAP